MDTGDVDTMGPSICHRLGGQCEDIGAGAQLVPQLQAACQGKTQSVMGVLRGWELQGEVQLPLAYQRFVTAVTGC